MFDFKKAAIGAFANHFDSNMVGLILSFNAEYLSKIQAFFLNHQYSDYDAVRIQKIKKPKVISQRKRV